MCKPHHQHQNPSIPKIETTSRRETVSPPESAAFLKPERQRQRADGQGSCAGNHHMVMMWRNLVQYTEEKVRLNTDEERGPEMSAVLKRDEEAQAVRRGMEYLVQSVERKT